MTVIKCRTYDIIIDDWISLTTFVHSTDYSSIVVIVDENTREFCLPIFKENTDFDFSIIEIPSGEKYKNIGQCQDIWEKMMHLGCDRHSLCINLGGGVIGDMGGFCASTYMRGMAFIQLPTTLLSQVDASIGGKLGIDLGSFKNMIGLIANPHSVFIFSTFLKSLPPRELRSGFAEMLKHSLISDEQLFVRYGKWAALNAIDWNAMIYESVMIKKRVTEQDPNERGLRKILNFGHTIGHAIESYNLDTPGHLLHGEAIAIGMIIEAYLSYKKDFIDIDKVHLISSTIIRLFGHHNSNIPSLDAILNYMSKDKKNKGGKIKFVLLADIGNAVYDKEVEEEFIEESLEYYKNLTIS